MNPEEMSRLMVEMRGEIKALQVDAKSTWKRIDEQKNLTDSVHTLALSVRDLTNAQKNTAEVISDLLKDVDELQAKPGKRWESVVGYILSGAIAAIITYLATRAGLK